MALVGVYLFKNLFLGFLVWRQTRFAYGVQANLSQRLFATYLRQPYTFHLQRNSASLMRNVTGEVNVFTRSIVSFLSMVTEARKYFETFSEKQRVLVKEIIRTLRAQEHEADKLEDQIKQKVFNMDIDPITVFHMIRLAEIIGAIADHAENAGDMMRAMVAK